MAVDAVVAAGMLTVLVAFTALGHPHHPRAVHPFALYVLAPFASLPLAVRRRWPVTVLAVVLIASVAFGVLGSATSTVTGASYALYTVAVQADRKWSLLALVAVEIGVAVNFALTTRTSSNPVNGAFTGLVQLTIWVIGDSVRRRRAYASGLRERSIRQALAEQRLQIARELHDVIAHALSVVAVQAGVGSHLIAARPDEAAKSLGAIEATARAALSETRYLLSALRDGDQGPASLVPVPGMGNLSALVKQIADAGLPVMLSVEGRPRELPPSLEVSAYRVVQEALTNVVRHGGRQATATVVIRYGDDGGVEVEVTDDGCGTTDRRGPRPGPKGDGSGHGLTGMRERVVLLGGELWAGPRAEGGYRVVAHLPAKAGAR
jgi:signal transduction histidine kinase